MYILSNEILPIATLFKTDKPIEIEIALPNNFKILDIIPMLKLSGNRAAQILFYSPEGFTAKKHVVKFLAIPVSPNNKNIKITPKATYITTITFQDNKSLNYSIKFFQLWDS